MNINQLILNILKDVGAPVAYLNYSGDERTYIRFFEYDQSAALEAEDDELYGSHNIQIDIFSSGNYLALVKKVKQMMKQAKFKKSFETEMFEDDTKLYHKVLRFYFISETEE